MAEIIRLSRSLRHPATTLRPVILSPSTPSTRRFSSTDDDVPPANKRVLGETRWLTDLTQRLNSLRGKKLKMSTEKYKELCILTQQLESHWIHMEGGRLGFLTGQEMRGLNRHEVAWGDMDSMGHVNNVVYNRYAESARVNWLRSFYHARSANQRRQWNDLMTPNSVGLILRSIKTEFKFPMTYPDRTTVLHRLARAPDMNTDHIYLEALILSERHRRIAATCREDIVVYDYKAGQKTKLKDFMVGALRSAFEKQQAVKPKAEKDIARFLQRVVEFEKSLGPEFAEELRAERAARAGKPARRWKDAAEAAAMNTEEPSTVLEESVGESPEAAAEKSSTVLEGSAGESSFEDALETAIEEASAEASAETTEKPSEATEEGLGESPKAAVEEAVEGTEKVSQVPEESVGEPSESTVKETSEETVEKPSEVAEETVKDSSETVAEDADKGPAVGENAEQTSAEKSAEDSTQKPKE